jgi:hypothetical protein
MGPVASGALMFAAISLAYSDIPTQPSAWRSTQGTGLLMGCDKPSERTADTR